MTHPPVDLTRRSFFVQLSAAVGLASLNARPVAAQQRRPTNFQVACMTLPYSDFPLQRALEGIAASGFRYVAWGTRHNETGEQRVPLLDVDAPPSAAKALTKRCTQMGLTPVMMFSGVSVESDQSVEAHGKRVRQAAEAGISQVLTMGSTEGGKLESWVNHLKQIGPLARAAGVTVVVKQHGGETATGEATAKLLRQVNDEGIRISYDAGNVLDYINVDPIQDVGKCLDDIRSFCIKDHRNFPKDEDCGPGFGEIDHYRLLAPVAFTGLTMPLAFENIFAPLLPRPATAEGIDNLARRAREFIETVITGLQS